jgi:hypothetical protein
MRVISLPLCMLLFVSFAWAQTGRQNAAVSTADAGAAKVSVQKEAAAAAASDLTVARAAIALHLEENEPVEPGDVFPVNVKQLYCFSQIKGAKDSAEIEHRWYWNDDLVFSRPLKVKSANWRTYSIKNIYPYMAGDWMVSIVNTKKEEVLKTLKFTIK